jgi:hypothetical protein
MSDFSIVAELFDKAIAAITPLSDQSAPASATLQQARRAVEAAFEGCRRLWPDDWPEELMTPARLWKALQEHPEEWPTLSGDFVSALQEAKTFLRAMHESGGVTPPAPEAPVPPAAEAPAGDPSAEFQEVLRRMGGGFPVRLTKKETLQDAEAKALAKAQETTSRRPKVPRDLRWNRKGGAKPAEKWEGGQIKRRVPDSDPDIWYVWDPKGGGYRSPAPENKLYRWAGGKFVPIQSDSAGGGARGR